MNPRPKEWYPGEYRRRDRIRASTEEYENDGESNSSEYQKIQDRKDYIRACTREYDRDRESNLDGESNSSEYQRIQDRTNGILASTGEKIISGRALKNMRQTGNRIHLSIGESKKKRMVSGRVPENTIETGNRIRPSTSESKTERMVSWRVPEKRSYSAEYWRIRDKQGIEFVPVSENPRKK
ncbi:hypothetical protein PVL29_002375 [Vitis rotundifolia]|uniref:Uncharacterized protein n=1 Tax=Vitis rotundifolia TaxID=103349 RepID=A0AA39E3S8_VITRO|nr:hypothetical protein PVL29_002375 [Vitis rotundifolia]